MRIFLQKVVSISVIILLIVACADSNSSSRNNVMSTILYGDNIHIFNGLPKDKGWGEDVVYLAKPNTVDSRVMGLLGGMPLVDIWTKSGGVTIFNTSTYQEPFSVEVKYFGDHVVINCDGGSNMEIYHHVGDYHEAIEEFAKRMKKKGLSVKPAPNWSFEPVWESYGFEEKWSSETVLDMIPLLKELGITTITLDSGWYGEGDENWSAYTGDFPINPDVIGDEDDLRNLINRLHNEGFKVKLWWTPAVAEKETILYKNHPDWFYSEVLSSTDDTEDWYLDPTNDEVIEWNRNIVKKFLSYGVDGFKQDDIYHINSDDSTYHKAYASLVNNNYNIATAIKPDFVINTCNCGVVQNFYHIVGQNQLITSDPVGSKQFRHRAKYLHALNLNGASILADHVELTQGNVGLEELDREGFYDGVDFASIIPLGLVFETKFRSDPKGLYRKWLTIYNRYKFYNMEWVNIPLTLGEIESCLMRSDDALYFSFFTPNKNEEYEGEVNLSHLDAGERYRIYDIVNEKDLGAFNATSDSYKLPIKFKHSLVIEVKKD